MTRDELVRALANLPENVAIGCVVEAGRIRGRRHLASRADVVAVVRACAEAYGVTSGEIMGRVRTARIVRARFQAYFLLLDLFDMSTVQVGLAFGGRCHTTIMHGAPKGEADKGRAAVRARVLAVAAMLGIGSEAEAA